MQLQCQAHLKQLGVSGYTVTAANGEGPRNRRAGDVDGGNIMIQCLVSRELSVSIMNHLEAEYFENYAIVAWVSAAEVIRKERYSYAHFCFKDLCTNL